EKKHVSSRGSNPFQRKNMLVPGEIVLFYQKQAIVTPEQTFSGHKVHHHKAATKKRRTSVEILRLCQVE
ncbi:hypothetical protein, partial [Segatella oulorum]|uniref:hypothetical protein n=1 Tax=Segatella oulorum TaxID=28136 RepID=UPI0036098901